MIPSKKQLEKQRWFEKNDEENQDPYIYMREPLDRDELEILKEKQKLSRQSSRYDEREF